MWPFLFGQKWICAALADEAGKLHYVSQCDLNVRVSGIDQPCGQSQTCKRMPFHHSVSLSAITRGKETGLCCLCNKYKFQRRVSEESLCNSLLFLTPFCAKQDYWWGITGAKIWRSVNYPIKQRVWMSGTKGGGGALWNRMKKMSASALSSIFWRLSVLSLHFRENRFRFALLQVYF